MIERLEKLRSELPVVINAISEAKKQGDLSENFEYHAAKRRKGEVEKEISELEDYVRSAIIAKLPARPTSVCFGCRVELESESGRISYIIVGDRESDVEKGSLSIGSPLFQAMIGKKSGSLVAVNGKEYKILSVIAVSDDEIEPVLFTF